MSLWCLTDVFPLWFLNHSVVINDICGEPDLDPRLTSLLSSDYYLLSLLSILPKTESEPLVSCDIVIFGRMFALLLSLLLRKLNALLISQLPSTILFGTEGLDNSFWNTVWWLVLHCSGFDCKSDCGGKTLHISYFVNISRKHARMPGMSTFCQQ